jgi:hypothetical protein
MSSNTAGRYSMLSIPVPGTTGTGLDQLVNAVFADTGLAGANTAPDLLGGAAAANAMNQIILEVVAATGAATDGLFTANEVVAMNAWIRTHRLTEWTALHGDDEGAEETGFHLVQTKPLSTRSPTASTTSDSKSRTTASSTKTAMPTRLWTRWLHG